MSSSVFLLAAGWGLFGALHSLLVEQRVRARAALPAAAARIYRLAYNLLTAASIVALVAFAVSLHTPLLYEVDGAAAVPLYALRAAGAGVGLVSAWHLGLLEFLGIAQLLGRAPAPGDTLRTDGIYGVCRHPMGLGSLLMVWGASAMSVAYLVSAISVTAYLVVGTWLEERDLVARFPQAYQEYRGRVPCFLPLGRVLRRGERQVSPER